MGGRLLIDVTLAAAGGSSRDGDDGRARRRGAAAAARLERWVSRLTRFDPNSDLCRLNADPGPAVVVGPTLSSVLAWAAAAQAQTGGIVDATLLRERLAAEHGRPAAVPTSATGVAGTRRWRLRGSGRRATVERPIGLRFDLDGVAKGWLADRALGLLRDLPGVVVDADGDIAIRLAPGDEFDVGVRDPRQPGSLLACLRIAAATTGRSTLGVATSGVSVHRWPAGGDVRDDAVAHHLIDPRTRRSARTDLIQATVVAASAREADALAKTAVILGRDAGLQWLHQAGAFAAVLVTTDGDTVATPASLPWLAAA